MIKNKYPKFLPSKPTDEDKFVGGSHKKLATTISNIITENKLEKKVIGLEGDWGSGKSQVIKIIKSELGNDYHIFIFDSWGSQEDLTRKTFLEQLINQLFNHDVLKDKKKWRELKNRLLSKVSTTYTQKTPRIKPYWLIISFAILLYGVLSTSYEYILSDYDIIKGVFFGLWKPLLWIYAIPILLFLLGSILIINEYFKERKENKKKELIDRETKWATWGKLFYLFSGDEINTEEVENVIEDEPSVKQFREYFKNIEDDIGSNKKLILVFDNLDRLDKDKIRSLWSSIHTFFAEDEKSFDSWVIIPYDKSKLIEHLGKASDGFIDKTFSINFRVTPPVVTEWENFLSSNFDIAFGNNTVSKEEKEYVIKLFDLLSAENTIKPRQVINYINQLVSMYKQWNGEIINGDIKLRYLALFCLTKDKIIESPNNTIIERSYLGNSDLIFEHDDELDTSMSMITFGVSKELADEVLLDRQIKQVLRSGDKDLINDLKKHKAFQSYFIKINKSVPLNQKIRGFSDILSNLENTFSKNMMNKLWTDFSNGIIDLDDQFKSFNDNHKAILTNTKPKFGKKVLHKLISSLFENNDGIENQNHYFNEIKEIENYLNEKQLKINLFDLLNEVNFSPESYFDFIENSKKEYKRYKIICDEDELIDSFYDENDIIKIDMVSNKIESLEILKEEYDFVKLSRSIEEYISTINYTDKEDLENSIEILKILKDKPLKLSLSNSFYQQLTSARLNEGGIYQDAFCIAISNLDTAHGQSGNFQNALRALTDEQVKNLSKKIEWYLKYHDLLLLVKDNSLISNYPKIKNIAKDLTYNDYGTSRLNVNWALKNFDIIATKVFDNNDDDIETFAKKLDRWQKHYSKSISDISTGFFKYLEFQELKLMQLITQDSIEYIKGLSKTEIIDLFKNDNRNFKILAALLNNNLIDKFSNEFYSAYDDYMKEIANLKWAIPDVGFWDELIDKLNSNKLRSTYTTIRDILINGGEVNENILYFFERGLIKYGNLNKKPESSTLKIIIPMIESDKNFGTFLNNNELFTDIINSSKEHKETAIGELQIRYDSDEYKDNEKMMQVAKAFKMKRNSKERDL